MKIKTRIIKAMSNPEVINLLFEIYKNEQRKPTVSLKQREQIEQYTALQCDKISSYIARNLRLQ